MKVLTRIILPAAGIAIWLTTCYYACRKPEGLDLFMFWIMAGCPFGIRSMFLWLVPKGYSLSAMLGIFAINLILGGLIGGVMLIIRIIKIIINVFMLLTSHFRTNCPQVWL